MNLPTILVLSVVAALVALALYFSFRRKDAGGCSGCSQCPGASQCPIAKKGKDAAKCPGTSDGGKCPDDKCCGR
ncbi:MAG: FeoB-associated Cys-rich membrane protein [Bacteroidaceae bacterium]|nr:FeoB-associated Cys-rich membrane protein [Bacteroidaceae bacterium]